MKKLRPYFRPVVTLISDLLILGWRIVRQLILPTLTRKGNLLSSLFMLFTGLIEQVIAFAEAVARVPRTFELPARFGNAWAFSRKYLRQGMLIAAWALFILSSLEWTSSRPAVTEQAAAQRTVQEKTTVEQTASLGAATSQSHKAAFAKDPDVPVARPLAEHLSIPPPPSSSRRWLLLCTLRI
ncbi:MAG TPA: hypothetical protein VGS79_16380 [Puia sp.]|nr:hypothetical protein [Puia sp.]